MRSLIKYLLPLVISCNINVFCQNSDSLKSILSKQKDTVLLKTYMNVGNTYYDTGLLDSATTYLNKGLSEANTQKNQKFVTNFLIKLGLMEREKGVYNRASEYYYKALEVADKNKYDSEKASCYNGIAIIAAIEKDRDKAFDYYNKSLDIYRTNNNLKGMASIYNNIGLLYLDSKERTIGLKYFMKALDINKGLKNDFGVAVNSENIGLIYSELKDFDLAYIYYNKALNIWYQRSDFNSISINQGYIASSFIKQKKWQQAIDTLLKSIQFAKQANSLSTQSENSYYLSNAYEGIGDHKNSLYYFKLAKNLGDSIKNTEKTKEITEIQLNYAFNKIKAQDSIKHQLEVKVKENELKTEKNYKYIISSVLLLILTLLFFVFKNYKEKTKSNAIIIEQKNLVEQKQKEILDSIAYAKRIQTALLTNDEFIGQNIKEHFILFEPKDMVSGDFYWVAKKDDLFYLAVCDSTGHGVPGAFMSLLNMGFLTQAVIEKQIEKPNEILNYVRKRLVNTISKEGQQDGFDGILISFNKRTNEILYAAANNAPVIITKDGLTYPKYDKMPVGKGLVEKAFNLYSLNLNKGDTLYLYTDGYPDQFGGPNGKKFKYKNLDQLLLTNVNLPFDEQKTKLLHQFNEWKGNLEQVDDVCVIGIKI